MELALNQTVSTAMLFPSCAFDCKIVRRALGLIQRFHWYVLRAIMAVEESRAESVETILLLKDCVQPRPSKSIVHLTCRLAQEIFRFWRP